MGSKNRITVVIPTYNRGPILGRAIDSVLAQTFKAAQVIVVDDGSTDQTAAVCSKYGDSIEYVRQANGGASASRNTGIRLAQHPWVAFLDSDDYWTPLHLERITTAIDSTNGAAVFYFADMQLPPQDGGGTLWHRIGFHPAAPYHLIDDAVSWVLMKQQPTMLQTSVFNKHALDQIGGLDTRFKLIHDSHVFCKLGIGGTVCAVSGVGCVQTADDASSVRLTTSAVPLGSERNASELRLMWAELLQEFSGSSRFRRLLRCNLADSHWGYGRRLMRSGYYRHAFGSLLKAIAIDPEMLLWLIRHGSRNNYEHTLRAICSDTATSVG